MLLTWIVYVIEKSTTTLNYYCQKATKSNQFVTV